MKQFHKQIFFWTISPPLAYCVGVYAHSMHHMFFGRIKNYEESRWFLDLSIAEKENVMQRRQPILDNLKRLYEMKETKLNSQFSDNVKYDDVFIRCLNKKELETCFCLMPKAIKTSVTNKFAVSHHQNRIIVDSERSVTFKNISMEDKIKNRLDIILSSQDQGEVVTHVVDKFNCFEILGPENNRYTGHLARLYRRLRTLYSLKILTKTKSASVGDDFRNSVTGIFVDDSHPDDKLLKQPIVNYTNLKKE